MSTTEPSDFAAPARSFTLRDLYEQARVSGNSLSVELARYLNIDHAKFASSKNGPSNESSDQPNIHELALSAILEVVTSNANATFDHSRVPEPPGGVQEWWARMLSGSLNNSPSSTGDVANRDLS